MGTRSLIVLALLAWQSGIAHADAFTVTNTNETGTGSLSKAIMDATKPGSHTIDITAMGTINLTGPLPMLSYTLTITGPGADKLTIQRSAGTFPIITVAGVVEISGVTIKNGSNTGVGGNGGGIVVIAGNSLVLRNSTVTGNTAAIGSAIYADGALTIQGSTISGNTGTGVTTTATIFASETTTVSDSTIADNAGTAIIFAPAVASKTLTIDRSTISGNMADKIGVDGLQLQGTATINAAAIIRNSTFSGNSGLAGGDFWTSTNNVALSLTNVTVVGNSAPSLLFDHTSMVNVTMRNTLFAGTGMRCNGGARPTSQGHNLTSDTSCNLAGVTDKTGMDPMLGSLAANGGTTKTHTPLAGSPAINAGDGTAVDVKEQRGLPRVQFGTVDIGAVEVAEPVISQQPAAQEVGTGKTLTLTIAATNQNSAMPLTFQWRKDGTAIAGATSDTFTKPNAAVEDSGMHDVLVTNEGGSVPSMAVAVTVSEGGGSGAGGCCSSTGQGAWSNAVLGLLMAVFLGVPRRSRAAQR